MSASSRETEVRRAVSAYELVASFDRIFEHEKIRAHEVSRTLLEAVPGLNFEHQLSATTDEIRDRIQVEARYAAVANHRPATRSRPQRIWFQIQEHKVIASVMVIGLVVFEMGQVSNSFERIGAATSGLLARFRAGNLPTASSVSFAVPSGHRFEWVATAIARSDGRPIDLSSCPPKLSRSVVAPGTVQAANTAALIRQLRGLLGHGAPPYVVAFDQDRGLYEVSCH